MSFRDEFKEYQLQWLAWMIILLATLAISLFFGVNYPVPDQPAEPPEPVELGSHFSNPIDITGSSSASAPALTFEGDTDTGILRSAADTLNIAAGGTELLEIDASELTIVPAVDFDNQIDVDGTADEIQLSVSGYTTQTSNLAVFEQSDGTDVVAIDNSGNVTLANGATIYGSTHTTGTHGMILVCSGSHDHSDAENPVRFCTIPANANVVDYGYYVETSWNDGSAATVDCGYEGESTDVDAFLDAYDVNGASSGDYTRMGAGATSPADTALGDIGNTDATIRCQVAETDDDASAGEATFYLWYQLD
jgi:hypothetical protein